MLDYTDSLRYISKIRNTNKQKYAFAYRNYLFGYTLEPDYHKFNICCMAAQAVRFDLNKMEVNQNG